VVRKPEAELGSALDRLITAGLLFRQGVPPHATYLFKHALVQDAAYGMLLREPRRALHARIADTLESQFAEIAERQPELLARHCTEAGLIEKAAALWVKACHRQAHTLLWRSACRRRSNAAAVEHLVHMATSTQKRATPIVLYLRSAHTSKHWLVRRAAQKTATYRSLRFFQLAAMGAHRRAHFHSSTLVLTAGAIGTQIVHFRAPVALGHVGHRSLQPLDRRGTQRAGSRP